VKRKEGRGEARRKNLPSAGTGITEKKRKKGGERPQMREKRGRVAYAPDRFKARKRILPPSGKLRRTRPSTHDLKKTRVA